MIWKATMVSKITVALMWFKVIVATMNQQWTWFTFLRQCVQTMTLMHIVATMYYNNALVYHCCINVFQQWPWFTLLKQCASTMTSDHGDCLVPRKNATDRQKWTGPYGVLPSC
jgi:hypothetical protein